MSFPPKIELETKSFLHSAATPNHK